MKGIPPTGPPHGSPRRPSDLPGQVAVLRSRRCVAAPSEPTGRGAGAAWATPMMSGSCGE